MLCARYWGDERERLGALALFHRKEEQEQDQEERRWSLLVKIERDPLNMQHRRRGEGGGAGGEEERIRGESAPALGNRYGSRKDEE